MEWYTTYKKDLKWAFEEAGQRIKTWDSPFEEQALRYLERFDVTEREIPTNYICFLLPFWMGPASGQDRTTSRLLSLAHIFGMMAYHLQDEAMDKPYGRLKETLALSALLQREFHNVYSRLFPANSEFWTYYKRYLFQWAEAVSGEDQQDWFHQEPLRLGHKASLVKLAVPALLIQARLPEQIPAIERAVDVTLFVLQLLDDWEDWRQDLEDGSYNSLAALARVMLVLPKEQLPSAEDVREALYSHGALSRLASSAEGYEPEVSQVKEAVPELHAFYHFLVDNLKQGARRIEEEKKLLEAGGLAYFLSKLPAENG